MTGVSWELARMWKTGSSWRRARKKANLALKQANRMIDYWLANGMGWRVK